MKWLCAVLFIIALILQFDLWLGHNSWPRLWQRQGQIQSMLSDNERLQQRNQMLSGEVLDLQKGNAAIEEIARTELGMIKKDEIFYQVIESNGGAHGR